MQALSASKSAKKKLQKKLDYYNDEVLGPCGLSVSMGFQRTHLATIVPSHGLPVPGAFLGSSSDLDDYDQGIHYVSVLRGVRLRFTA